MNELKAWDLQFYQDECDTIFFVDEVGRGCLCGDVVACAIAVPKDFFIVEVKDSKKISPKKREMIYDRVVESGIKFAIGSVSPERIDEINILQATYEAMNMAIRSLSDLCKKAPTLILVDGNAGDVSGPCEFVPKGDSTSFGIGCASIIAKVHRDNMCIEWSKLYPGYGIEQHKGYGTKQHRKAILEKGPTPIHRKSFLRNILKGV